MLFSTFYESITKELSPLIDTFPLLFSSLTLFDLFCVSMSFFVSPSALLYGLFVSHLLLILLFPNSCLLSAVSVFASIFLPPPLPLSLYYSFSFSNYSHCFSVSVFLLISFSVSLFWKSSNQLSQSVDILTMAL